MTTTNNTAAALARAAACALLLAQAGCYGDLVSTGGDRRGDDGSDGPAGDGDGDGVGDGDQAGDGEPAIDAAPISGDAQLVCVDPAGATGDGHHRAGQACATCHDGAIGPAFTVGGTLYADPDGATAVAGATITLIDADGERVDLVTADNGNFWTGRAVAFPVTTYASSCPDLVPMETQAGTGDCNGCHAAGDAITFAP